MNHKQIQELKKLIKEHNNIVVLTGAGVSVASGIPDFRSPNGLYKKFKNAEYLLSIDALVNNTHDFFKFYREQILLDNIKPNEVHYILAKWGKQNKVQAVITQNIDGLHTLAGSKNVIELHGTIHKNYCMNCRKTYDLAFIKNAKDIPQCSCGGIVRPQVVLYGESLYDDTFQACLNAINNTNLLIVVGTGLSVSTAAGIVNMYRGKNLVIINNEPTPFDSYATIVIRDDLTKVFKELDT